MMNTARSHLFILILNLSDGTSISLELSKSAVMKDLRHAILKRYGHSDCKTCKNKMHKNLLYFVNRQGQGSFADTYDGLYQYDVAKCKFFWLEENFRVVTIFFGENDIASRPVTLDIQARELCLISPFKERLRELDWLNVDLIYKKKKSTDEVLVLPDDQPMKLYYNEKGEEIDDSGKLYFRQNTFKRQVDDSEERLQQLAGKERANRKNVAFLMNKINDKMKTEDVLNSSLNPDENHVTNKSTNTVYVTSQISETLMRTKSVNFQDCNEDDFINCRPPVALNAPVSLADLLTVVDEIDSDADNYLLENEFVIDERNDIVVEDVETGIISNEGTTEDERALYPEVKEKPWTLIQGGETSLTNDLENDHKKTAADVIVGDFVQNDIEIETDDKTSVNIQENVSGETSSNEISADLISEKSLTNTHDESFSKDNHADINRITDNKFQGILMNENTKDVVDQSQDFKSQINSKEKIQISKCHLCEQLHILPERVSSIDRLNEILQCITSNQPNINNNDYMNYKTGEEETDSSFEHEGTESDDKETTTVESIDSIYICLSGVHLKYRKGSWLTTDGSTIGRLHETSYHAKTKDENTINIGNGILCTYVPSVSMRRFRWLVKSRSNVKCELDESNTAPVTVLPDIAPLTMLPDTPDDDDENETCHSGEFVLLPPEHVHRPAMFPSLNMSSLQHNIKGKISLLKNKVKTKAGLIDSKLVGPVKNDTEELNIIYLNTRYMKPLTHALCLIAEEFRNINSTTVDDMLCPRIGWLIRDKLCESLAAILNDGLTQSNSYIRGLFTRTEPLTLWSLMKDFSKSFDREEFYCEDTIIKLIDCSKYLKHDDNMKFRYYVCDLIKRVDGDGNKLIVTWFKLFSRNTTKLEKYYDVTSFWRRRESQYFDMFFNENIIAMLKVLNQWTFNLHIEFELQHTPTSPIGSKEISNDGDEFSEVYMFE